MQPGIFFKCAMNKILPILIFSIAPLLVFSQTCNEKEAIKNFTAAQETDDSESAVLFEKAAEGFKCCKQFDNYLISAYQSGIAYFNIGNLDKAQTVLEQSLQDTKGLTDSTSEVNMLIYHTLGEVYYGIKNAERSVFYYQKAVGILGTDDSEELAICLFNMGNSYEMLSLYADAIGCHRKSIEMKRRLEIADSSDYYQAYSTLADIYQSVGKTDSSDYFYRMAGQFTDTNDSESAAFIKFKEAQKNYDEKNLKVAEALFDETRNICEIANLRNDVFVGSCLYLGLIYESDGNQKKAASMLAKAAEYQKEKNDTYYNILLAQGRIEKADNQSKAIEKLNKVVAESKNSELVNLARIELAKIYEAGNPTQAKQLYNQVMASVDSTSQTIIYVQALCGLASIESQEGKGDKAISSLLRAKKTLGGKDPEFEANIYEQIGNEYFKQGNNEKALMNYREAASILSKTFGKGSVKAMSAEENVATVLMDDEKFAEAAAKYELSLAIKSKALGEYNPQLIDLYSNYGNALCNMRSYEKAGDVYEKCLQIIEKENIADTRLDVFYNNYGLYCKTIGDYKSALTYTEKSLNAKQKIYGKESAKYASTLNNLGTIYDKLGNFNKSAECFEQAELIMAQAASGNVEAISEIYINKGNLYNRLGQNELALTYYNKALEVKTEKNNASDKKLAPIYNNIGTVSQNIEDYRLAQYYFKKSLDITLKYGGSGTQEAAEAYNNLGNVMLKTGKIRDAISNYLKASSIYNKIPAVNPVLIGNTNNNIATAYQQLNQLDSAQFYYHKSADLYKNVFGDKHPHLALIYNNIGNIDLKLEKYADALADYSRAIESNHESFNSKTDSLPSQSGYYDQNTFVNSLLLRASALSTKFISSRDVADLKYAFKHYQFCDEIIVNMRRSALTKTDKLELGKLASKCYEGALEVCAELLNSKLTDRQRRYYQEQAFSFIEKGKSNSLLESMAGQDAMQLANIPTDVQQKENQLSADVLYYEQMLAEKPKNAAQVRDSLLNANRKHDAFVKKLEKEYPEYHQLKYADNVVSLNELQQKLQPGTQLRMYMLGNDAVYAVLITNSQFDIVMSPASQNISDTVRQYRNSMIQSSQKATMDFSVLSRRFYKMLFADTPADDVTRLVVVPDGVLNQIPFESLLTNDIQGSVYNYQDYDFLIKKYAVSYAYSATLYYRDITRKKDNGTNGWFGLAPVFTQGKYSGVVLDSRIKKHERTFTDIQVVSNNKLEPLPSSEPEVRNIFSMFVKAGQPARACLWGSANRQNFNSDSVSRYRYIHLATHGFVNSENPELSGVQLSQLRGDNSDGVLYSGDVYGLKLNCDLLILSACETGLGKIMKGEGIVGLSRAFIYAGSRNLLVSLWKVADNSTSQMMVEFYRQLLLKENSGLNYAEILQKAKQMLILDKNYSRPYYWAPFILIGD